MWEIFKKQQNGIIMKERESRWVKKKRKNYMYLWHIKYLIISIFDCIQDSCISSDEKMFDFLQLMCTDFYLESHSTFVENISIGTLLISLIPLWTFSSHHNSRLASSFSYLSNSLRALLNHVTYIFWHFYNNSLTSLCARIGCQLLIDYHFTEPQHNNVPFW